MTLSPHAYPNTNRWSKFKSEQGLQCNESIHDLTGGKEHVIRQIQFCLERQEFFTWANYGDAWEILVDHHFPLSKMRDYKDKYEKKRVNNFTNLWPMIPKDNRDKENQILQLN